MYVHLLWLVSQVGVDASLQGVGVVFKDGDQSNCVRGNLLVVRRAVQRRRIVALRHMGYTYGQIAQEVGVDRRMCWRMCQVS